MAAFPSSNPPLLQEHIDFIRWWLGNITDTTITDADMTDIINTNITKYGTDNCKIAYYSTVDILRWLIREGAKGSAGSVGSGAVKKRKEKIKNREIEVEFDVGTSSGQSTGWDKVLEDLLANPSTIGCNPIDSSSGGDGASGAVIIGVNTEKYTFSSPWRSNQNRGLTGNRWRY